MWEREREGGTEREREKELREREREREREGGREGEGQIKTEAIPSYRGLFIYYLICPPHFPRLIRH